MVNDKQLNLSADSNLDLNGNIIVELGDAVSDTDLINLSQLDTKISGASSSTDNAIATFNLTGGNYIQNTLATVDVDGNIYIPSDARFYLNNVSLTDEVAPPIPPEEWTIQTTPANDSFYGLCYGGSQFVAVGLNGIMTSPDGITWTDRTLVGVQWLSVCYGNGTYVAVGNGSLYNKVITSTDGITWTPRTASHDIIWHSVVYGAGLFVAVSSSYAGNEGVMTSPDGITWTNRNSGSNHQWNGVAYSGSLFVAVSYDGYIMSSTDGITWTPETPDTAGCTFTDICFADGLFVAVAASTGPENIMTSPDGTTWTTRTAPVNNNWESVSYGNGKFMAISSAYPGIENRAMYSTDGITWVGMDIPVSNYWSYIAYGNNRFVAVSYSGTLNRAMTLLDD